MAPMVSRVEENLDQEYHPQAVEEEWWPTFREKVMEKVRRTSYHEDLRRYDRVLRCSGWDEVVDYVISENETYFREVMETLRYESLVECGRGNSLDWSVFPGAWHYVCSPKDCNPCRLRCSARVRSRRSKA